MLGRALGSIGQGACVALLLVAAVVVGAGCKTASDSGALAGGGGGGGVAGAGGATSGGGGGSAGRGGAAGSEGAAGGAGAGGNAGAAGGAGLGGADGAAGAGGGNPCGARAGLRFCDTFESMTAGSAPSGAPWSLALNGGGTVTIDATTPAHSGSKSVHVHGGTNDSDYDTLFALHDPSILPAPNGRFFFRAFLRPGRTMSDGHNTYVIADLFAKQGQGNNLRLGEDSQMLMYTIMGDGHGALSHQNFFNDHIRGVQFTPNSWTCLEVLLDSARPEIDVWVDGVEVPDLHHTDWPIDNYDNLRLGFEKYAGPALDIWYDDVAVGTERIGCN